MIDILMASYNGEKYIAEQIKSIINQTYKNWHLYIKDDCSTDNTIEIIKNYIEKYHNKITLVESDKGTGSAKNNFFSMLYLSKSQYTMFCDQDDIWLPDKIEVTHRRMLQMERKYGKQMPLLIHTDMSVVDEELNILHDSKYEYDGIKSKIRYQNFRNTIFENTVSGCNMEVNRALLKCVDESDAKDAYMHDWWMALCAKAFGKISYIDRPTMLYRQHDMNTCGVMPRVTPISILKRFLIKKNRIQGLDSIKELNIMYESFYKKFRHKMKEEDRIDISKFVKSFKSNKIKKIHIVLLTRFRSLRLKTFAFYLFFC